MAGDCIELSELSRKALDKTAKDFAEHGHSFTQEQMVETAIIFFCMTLHNPVALHPFILSTIAAARAVATGEGGAKLEQDVRTLILED